MSARLRATLALALLACGCATSPRGGGRDDGVRELRAATWRLLEALDATQRRQATCPLEDDEIQRWHFVPGRYAGVLLGDLDDAQRAAADALLQAMLSASGMWKVAEIIRLEDVLRALESAPGVDVSHRDPRRYALLVAGDPRGDAFVVRFQGHHVSLRAAVVGDVLASCTPQFLGSNPHRGVGRWAPHEGLGPALGPEEDLARELLASLDEQQRARAVIAATAPSDVLLGPGRPPAALGERRGLAWSEMTPAQRGRLWVLIEHYAHRLRGDFALAELERVRARGLDDVHFAWAGSLEPGRGHYYRIHADEWAIEYDCTQDDANHVHTVWRDFERDLGGDALREHLRQHAAPAPTTRYAVRLGDKWGFVDRSGALVIPARFDTVGAFVDGLAKVEVGVTRKGTAMDHGAARYGFVDERGAWRIQPTYEYARDFSEGLAAVRVARRYGYVDTNGEGVIPPRWSGRVGDFHEGRAWVELARDRLAYIDRDGEVVFEVRGCDASDPADFSEGLVRVAHDDDTVRYYDRDGRCALELLAEFGGPFRDGLARVRHDGAAHWSYVDREGALVLSGFEFAGDFGDGFAIVTRDGQQTFVDRDGNVPFDCAPYEDLSSFSEGLARVRSKATGRYGYVDRDGRLVVAADWDDPMAFASRFRNGRALVADARRGARWRGLIDTAGALVWSTPAK